VSFEGCKFTAAESKKLFIDDRADVQVNPVWALAGKILAPKPKIFHIQTIAEILRPAWGNPRGLVFRDGGPNLFVAELPTERERDRIWERSPWTVNKHAVVLENFKRSQRPSELKFDRLPIWIREMNLPFNLHDDWGEKIAGSIGDFISIDKSNKMLVSGKYLRARVAIDVNAPLQRWIPIDSTLREACDWYEIKYEELPYFCFSCGLLGHSDLVCMNPAERDEKGRLPYWQSLRAPDDRKRRTGSTSWNNFPGDHNTWAGANNSGSQNSAGTNQHPNRDGPGQYAPPPPAGGRGRGHDGNRGGRFANARGNTQVYRRLTLGDKPVDMDTDKSLVMFDPHLAGVKRDERPSLDVTSPAPSPDPKKSRVTTKENVSTSENVAVTDSQSRQAQ
jgi:hypothetical protein